MVLQVMTTMTTLATAAIVAPSVPAAATVPTPPPVTSSSCQTRQTKVKSVAAGAAASPVGTWGRHGGTPTPTLALCSRAAPPTPSCHPDRQRCRRHWLPRHCHPLATPVMAPQKRPSGQRLCCLTSCRTMTRHSCHRCHRIGSSR